MMDVEVDVKIVVLLAALAGTAGCFHEDHCPGKLTCDSMVCCPLGFPYHCGDQCYASPPTTNQCPYNYETCYDDNGGGGGGGGGGTTLATWNGGYTGPCTSMDPGLPSQTMNVTLQVSNGVITSGAPNGGSVTASGFMSVTVLDRLGTPFPVSGQISLTASFNIHGTTPSTQDATSITCTLTKL
jgi:hypothetical protein